MPKTEPVNRIIGRLVAEMVLASLWSTTHLLDSRAGKAARADRAAVFLAVLGHSLADEGAAPRGVSVHALAQSFGRPFESMRRQVNALIADGWCARVPSGVVIAPRALASAEVEELMVQLHDLIVWLAAQFRTDGLPLPSPRPGRTPTRSGMTAIAIELVLATVDFAAAGYRSIREFYVVHSIIQASVRGVTFDPVLTRRYSALSTIPADEHRLPVNVPSLCQVLGLPTVTVYRQVGTAIAEGKLERIRGGVRATAAFLGSEMTRTHLRIATARAARAMDRLALEGFPFDAASTQYVAETPVFPNLAP